MTGPKDIIIGALIIALLVTSVTVIICKSRNSTLKTEVELYETRERIYKTEIESCSTTISNLQTTIDEQNISNINAAEMGAKAQKAQSESDTLARRLRLTENKLSTLINEQRDFEALTVTLDTCQTYELVLRSISGDDL